MKWNDFTSIKTPCYIIDNQKLKHNTKLFVHAFGQIPNIHFAYSVKTNPLRWIIKQMYQLGWKIEIVSHDEYLYVKSLGIHPRDVILNGVNNHLSDISEVLNAGGIVNIDSFDTIERLADIGCDKGVGLRVKVRPGNLTEEIGYADSRFGFCVENGELFKAIEFLHQKNICIRGLHIHLSSRSRSPLEYNNMSVLCSELFQLLSSEIQYIDFGGGFRGGDQALLNDYQNSIISPFSAEVLSQLSFFLEPGAAIVATAVSYLSKVVDIRESQLTRFIQLDGSRIHTDPTFSNKKYKLDLIRKNISETVSSGMVQSLCGCTCMEKDRFTTIEADPNIEKGDYVLFRNLGAYVQALSPQFSIGFPPIYMYDGNSLNLIQKYQPAHYPYFVNLTGE